MLHYPFYKVDKVLTINSSVFNTFTSAYAYCRGHYSHAINNSYRLPALGINKEDTTLEPAKDLEIDNFDELAGR
jgi:hypothetical protein